MAFYYNRCDAVFCPSKVLANELLEYKLKVPIHVISNPMDLDLFSSNKSKETLRKKFGFVKPTIIHWGRLSYAKSVDVLFKAFAQIRSEGMSAHLLIIGDGPDRQKLEFLCKKLGLEEDVEFTGMLRGPDLTERVAASDFFASASTTETQGLVFLEAMAMGLPVVGVNAGGVPEYVTNNQNGLIVESGNVKAVADAMRVLIEQPELRRRLGINAQESVKKYGADAIIEKFEKIYQELINKI